VLQTENRIRYVIFHIYSTTIDRFREIDLFIYFIDIWMAVDDVGGWVMCGGCVPCIYSFVCLCVRLLKKYRNRSLDIR
jgi:hypothetical protein